MINVVIINTTFCFWFIIQYLFIRSLFLVEDEKGNSFTQKSVQL